MGFFNTLLVEINCPDCAQTQQGRIQFKFGHTRQLTYQIGDTVVWRGANDIGNPDLKMAKAYGIIESANCIFCAKKKIAEEYDVFIDNNVIISFAPIESLTDYLEEGDGNYVSLDK